MAGLVKINSSNGKPLSFRSGGEMLALRVLGGLSGDTALIFEAPQLKNANGELVMAAVSGGRARVE